VPAHLVSSIRFAPVLIRPSVVVLWGAGADIPVPGDYDATGRPIIAVYRPSPGTCISGIEHELLLRFMTVAWVHTICSDLVAPSDYDGYRRSDNPRIFRPFDGPSGTSFNRSQNFSAFVSIPLGDKEEDKARKYGWTRRRNRL